MTSELNFSDLRILFIGNSFTSRNNLPRLLTSLALAVPNPKKVHAHAIVAGGASLRRHWNAGTARTALETSRWDYVVLKEQSRLPIKNTVWYYANYRPFESTIREQ